MLIDVTTYDSQQREFIEVPDHGPVEIFRNAPFSITTTAVSGLPLANTDTWMPALPEEPLESLPWDAPTPPTPPRGFENLPASAPTRK